MKLNAKSELFLYEMLWAAGQLMQPTFRNLDESFEGWAYRNGLLAQVHRLEAKGFLESRRGTFDRARVHRLTEAGRIAALGGRDPEAAWATPWDRRWRLFLFDIPEADRALRRRLTRSLASMGCGCLQGSVWIAAARPPGSDDTFAELGADCSHMMILEAESKGSDVDRNMVEVAWDFDRINALYRHHLAVMKRLPRRGRDGADALAAWAAEENAAWLSAVRSDPLLPAALLPGNYLGRKAWDKRKDALARAATVARQAMQAR